jgi:hypothetical protein
LMQIFIVLKLVKTVYDKNMAHVHVYTTNIILHCIYVLSV